MADLSARAPVFVIDQEMCAGHGRCYTLAPGSFTPDDNGYGTPTGRPETERDPAELRRIVASCPEQAISIEDRGE